MKKHLSRLGETLFTILFGVYFLASSGGFTVLFGWITYTIYVKYVNNGPTTLSEWLWGSLACLTGILTLLFGVATILITLGYIIIVVSRIVSKSDDPFARD